jgi:phosphomannomutase
VLNPTVPMVCQFSTHPRRLYSFPAVNFSSRHTGSIILTLKPPLTTPHRNGIINISPIGRNASQTERLDFQAYEKVHHIRSTFVRVLQEKFPDFGLLYYIGGQISFGVFPTGWNKTYCLRHVEAEKKRGVEYKVVHYFGDKTFKGGNVYEVFVDGRTVGHSVGDPDDTIEEG